MSDAKPIAEGTGDLLSQQLADAAEKYRAFLVELERSKQQFVEQAEQIRSFIGQIDAEILQAAQDAIKAAIGTLAKSEGSRGVWLDHTVGLDPFACHAVITISRQ